MVYWLSSFVSIVSQQPDQCAYIFHNKKTCTATISPGTIGTSSNWARELLILFARAFAHMYIVVYSIFFLETVQTGLSGADLFYWFAAGFQNTRHLTAPFASFVDVPMMGSVVSLSVQFFFVYRIFVLSEKRSWRLCAIICLVTLSLTVSERHHHSSRSSPLLAH
jgi:hypothetical protein